MNTGVQLTNKCYLKPAPGSLLFVILLIWGWQCDYLAYAAPMAIMLLIRPFITGKLTIDDQGFNKLTDLSSLLFAVVSFYVFYEYSFSGIYQLLSLVPFILYPLLLIQSYNSAPGIKLSALFLSLRRLGKDSEYKNDSINLDYPYIFITLLAASSGIKNPSLFFFMALFIFSIYLWSTRVKHRGAIRWILMLTVIATSGYAGQIGIQKLQGVAETVYLDWLDKFMWHSRDPERTSTAIGMIGKLKQSERIVLRINTHGEKLIRPLYLRESSYLDYEYGLWTNLQNTMRLVDPDTGGNSWTISRSSDNKKTYTISFYFSEDTSVIPAPLTLTGISHIAATELSHSPYGTTSMRYKKGWAAYDVSFSDSKITDSTPDKDELEIPVVYRNDLKMLIARLGISNQDDQTKLDIIENYFHKDFKYTLTQRERYPRGKYLTKFLFETKAGHCEYFATATALLLRAANIPTRYVVGYLVDEYSPLEGQYIARGSHAHSWVLAYVNNAWVRVDTTPSIWLTENDTSVVRPLVDLLSWINYRLFSSTESDNNRNYQPLLYLILLLLIAYYMRQLYISGRTKKSQGESAAIFFNGLDSGFYEIIKMIEISHSPHGKGKTLKSWLMNELDMDLYIYIKPALEMHYRYRFDTDNFTDADKQKMEELNSNIKNRLQSQLVRSD